MAKYLQDFSNGPLDYYRKKASFDWKKMKVFLFTEEVVEFKQQVYKELQEHSMFIPQDILSTPSFEEQRKISAARTVNLLKLPSFSLDKIFANVKFQVAKLKIMIDLDPSATIKNSIAYGMFPSAIQGLGTDRHTDYIFDSLSGKIIGAYCLTEFGHGSNAKSIQTTATYDKKSKEFILHSPNFEAAKCWAGNLGEMATHAIVYAQLIMPGGINHSMHPFIVNIRDPDTFLPYPGIIVGDMGEKIALNGVDNGFVMFNQYRIPRVNLLNKNGDVTEEGKYVTPYKDPNKRHGASLGALSVGRVVIIGLCSTYANSALTVAIRYAAVRKQFGPEGGEEVSILEYQSHQHRLIPYLAAAYILQIFSEYIGTVQFQIILDSFGGIQNEQSVELGLELHAISSGGKPLAGWIVRDAVQECREACAGHGYLKAAGLGDIRNSNDANCTYEGENHILIQQTSNWLLKFWPLILNGQQFKFPLGSVDFLSNAREILNSKFTCKSVEQFAHPENILKMYQWLVCYLLKTSYEKYETLSKTMDPFWARSESQVYYLKNLAIVYIQHFMIQRTYITLLESQDPQIQAVLTKITALYGAWTLEKHIPTFYEGGYATGSGLVTLLHSTVLNLCKDLKNDVVALIDVIAPPDFLNKSVLGKSDGLVYKHLEDAMLRRPGATSRPSWWKEINEWNNASLKSKL